MKIQTFITRIRETRDEEILCSDCLDQVSQFVDLELDGQPAETLMPMLHQHLIQCPVCMEEYHLLRELAQAEYNGLPPSIDDLSNIITNK